MLFLFTLGVRRVNLTVPLPSFCLVTTRWGFLRLCFACCYCFSQGKWSWGSTQLKVWGAGGCRLPCQLRSPRPAAHLRMPAAEVLHFKVPWRGLAWENSSAFPLSLQPISLQWAPCRYCHFTSTRSRLRAIVLPYRKASDVPLPYLYVWTTIWISTRLDLVEVMLTVLVRAWE